MRERMTKQERMGLGIHNPGRSCVHAESGSKGIPKICIHGYECWHCAFNQWLEVMEEKKRGPRNWNTNRDLIAKAA